MTGANTTRPTRPRRYVGRGSGPRGWVVTVVDDNGTHALPEHPRHSPDAHAWGYNGSGPAQLALDLLWDVLGVEPAPALYQRFNAEVVTGWPQDGDWSMSAEQIVAWRAEVTE